MQPGLALFGFGPQGAKTRQFKFQSAGFSLGVRDSARGGMSQCRVGEPHRPPGGHRSHRLSVRAHVREKWPPTANSRVRWPLDAAGLHRRKIWQTAGLRSRAVASEHGEMAVWAPRKTAIFGHFPSLFCRFSPGFSARFPIRAQNGANSAPNSAGFEPRPVANKEPTPSEGRVPESLNGPFRRVLAG